MFGKKCRNSVSGASCTNAEANHQSVARFFIKKGCTNYTNCCNLFEAYRTLRDHSHSPLTTYSSHSSPPHPIRHSPALSHHHFNLLLRLCLEEQSSHLLMATAIQSTPTPLTHPDAWGEGVEGGREGYEGREEWREGGREGWRE